jgi:hypothetical protein
MKQYREARDFIGFIPAEPLVRCRFGWVDFSFGFVILM